MSLIQELIHLNLNNLNIKYLNSGEGSYSFILSTASGKLVAIGWHIADLFNEKEYSFKDKKSHLLVNYFIWFNDFERMVYLARWIIYYK